jgi:4-hydroxy-tetrahydrodipicolinate synthase
VNGLTILGIAGEAHRLTDEERRRVVETVVKETRARVPVAVGVSASGTHLAAAFARMAREHGADALMVAPPAGLKTLDAVAEYYRAVAAATGCRSAQDEPVTTQVNAGTFIAQVPEIAQPGGQKSPDAAQDHAPPRVLRRPTAIRRPRGVYFEELSRADGAMTGFPPEALRAIREHFVAGRRDEAHPSPLAPLIRDRASRAPRRAPPSASARRSCVAAAGSPPRRCGRPRPCSTRPPLPRSARS